MTSSRSTTLSFAHGRPDLPGASPSHPRWPRLARLFGRESNPGHEVQREDLSLSEHQRREAAMRQDKAPAGEQVRRPATMVAEDRPQPVLKPILALARDVDRTSFDTRWEAEWRAAMRTELVQRYQDLLGVKKSVDRTMEAVNATNARAAMGDPQGATREMFKIYRQGMEKVAPVMARSERTLARNERFIDRSSRE